jgi:hypothetical protein
MRKIPAMVDMARTPAEVKAADEPSAPTYPYGLTLCLCNEELEKLGLDGECEVGDLLHVHAMAKVTSVSKMDNESSGPSCRVELQIVSMVGENEDDENEAAEPTPAATRRNRLYG